MDNVRDANHGLHRAQISQARETSDRKRHHHETSDQRGRRFRLLQAFAILGRSVQRAEAVIPSLCERHD